MKTRILGLLAVALLAAPMAANAALISKSLEITGSNFAYAFGDGSVAPVDPLTINFSVTFDNAASFNGTTVGLTVNSFNLPYAVQFAYDQVDDRLILGTVAGTGGCGNPVNSFCIFVSAISSNANAYFAEQVTSSGGGWQTRNLTTQDTQDVPEPGTLALLGLGLAGIGFSRRRKAI